MSESEDVCQLVDNDELGPRFQNTGTLQVRDDADDSVRHGVTSLEYINPALQFDEDESPNQGESRSNNTHSGTDTYQPSFSNGVNESAENGFQNKTNGVTSGDVSGCGSASCENTCAACAGNSSTHDVTSPPVYYSTQTGESTFVREPVVVTRPDGTRVIQTQQCCHRAPHRYRRQKPLLMRHIKLLQAFSIVSLFIFFPLGIPAVYFAFKTETEFLEGTTVRGNIDMARKLASRTEKLIIFSVLAALLVAVGVFAVLERHLMGDDEDYWKDANNNRILHGG